MRCIVPVAAGRHIGQEVRRMTVVGVRHIDRAEDRVVRRTVLAELHTAPGVDHQAAQSLRLRAGRRAPGGQDVAELGEHHSPAAEVGRGSAAAEHRSLVVDSLDSL